MAPRKVVIDRKKKLYRSINVAEVLSKSGVDVSTLRDEGNIPLEPFDDTE